MMSMCSRPSFRAEETKTDRTRQASLPLPDAAGEPEASTTYIPLLNRRRLDTRAWTATEDRLLGTRTDREVATMLGRHPVAVCRRRLKLGIAPHGRTTGPGQRTWTATEDALLGTMPDRALAKKLGCSFAAVQKRRRAHGIAAWRTRYHGRPWTAAEDALLGTLPDREVAARLGIHLQEVFARRHELGIASWRDGGRRASLAASAREA